MRDPARIPIVLDAIQKLWIKQPDLRLHQLLAIISQGAPGEVENDFWNVEDEVLLTRIPKTKIS